MAWWRRRTWRRYNKSGFCANVFYCAGFATPAGRELARTQLAGVAKAPRHEVAGSWVRLGSERYGELMVAPTSIVGRTLARRHVDVCTRERSGGWNGHFGGRSEGING